MKWIINREKMDAGFDEAHFHLSLASLIAKNLGFAMFGVRRICFSILQADETFQLSISYFEVIYFI